MRTKNIKQYTVGNDGDKIDISLRRRIAHEAGEFTE